MPPIAPHDRNPAFPQSNAIILAGCREMERGRSKLNDIDSQHSSPELLVGRFIQFIFFRFLIGLCIFQSLLFHGCRWLFLNPYFQRIAEREVRELRF